MSSGQHSNTFTIHKATPLDEGEYYCVARKSGITVQSNTASVVVDGKHIHIVKPLLWDTYLYIGMYIVTITSKFIQTISHFDPLCIWLSQFIVVVIHS